MNAGKNLEFGLKSYLQPTPKNARLLGDFALVVAGIGLIVTPGAKWVAIVGIVGKFLSNSFAKRQKTS